MTEFIEKYTFISMVLATQTGAQAGVASGSRFD